jgi:NAD(P)H-dependent flavin oxidoreductase YrpB (nitropropane dioxygenase family)
MRVMRVIIRRQLASGVVQQQQVGVPMSFETRKQDAEKMLRKWKRATRAPSAQITLMNNPERLWQLAQGLAVVLDNLYAHARTRE